MRKSLLVIACATLSLPFFLISCGEGFTPGAPLKASNELGDKDPGQPGDPQDPGEPSDPGGGQAPGGDDDGDPGSGAPGDGGSTGFLPSHLPSLTLWLKGSEHKGQLSNGFAVGEMGSELLNLAEKGPSTVGKATLPATYSKGLVSPFPSFVLCGAKAAQCASSFFDEGAQLKLADSYKNYPLLQGHGAKTPACSTCSGSYTITALVRRTSKGPNILLSNKSSASGVGPYLAWPGEKALVFSTQGASGKSRLESALPGFPEGLELVTAVYTRNQELKLYWQGELRGFDLLAGEASSTSSSEMPTLGAKNAPETQKLHVFEYLEFNEDLTVSDTCRLHSYFNEAYDLELKLTTCQEYL